MDLVMGYFWRDRKAVLWVEASYIFIHCGVLIWRISHFTSQRTIYIHIHLDILSNILNLFNAIVF